jgi:hypothetical protein
MYIGAVLDSGCVPIVDRKFDGRDVVNGKIRLAKIDIDVRVSGPGPEAECSRGAANDAG